MIAFDALDAIDGEELTLTELKNVDLQTFEPIAKSNVLRSQQNQDSLYPICSVCERCIIDDEILRISDCYIHDCCARCAECGTNLTHELSCFVDESRKSTATACPRLICYSDYIRLFTKRCASCRDLIMNGDSIVRAVDKSDKSNGDLSKSERLFHTVCFRCAFCSVFISSGELFKFNRGILRCSKHLDESLFAAPPVYLPTPQYITPLVITFASPQSSAQAYSITTVPTILNCATNDNRNNSKSVVGLTPTNGAPTSLSSPPTATLNAQLDVNACSFFGAQNSDTVEPGASSASTNSATIQNNLASNGNVPLHLATEEPSAKAIGSSSLQITSISNGSTNLEPTSEAKKDVKPRPRPPRRKSATSKSRNSVSAENITGGDGNSNDASKAEEANKSALNGIVLPFPIKERRGGRQRGVPSKRPRTVLTPFQREQFEKIFTVVHKPNRKLRDSLARQYHLTTRVVQVWFQNQRAKEKRIAMGLPASASAAAKHMRMMNALALAGKLPATQPSTSSSQPTASSSSNSNILGDGDDEDNEDDGDIDALDSDSSSAASNTHADSTHSSSKLRNDIDLAALNITLNLNLDLGLEDSPSSSVSN